MRDHFPNTLSGGEKQRLALGRALVNQPKILLVDEPTASLDRATAREVIRLIPEAKATNGLTVIVASHDPLMRKIADRELSLEAYVPGVNPAE